MTALISAALTAWELIGFAQMWLAGSALETLGLR